ncbi:MAG: FMN-binding protein [Acidobacteriota bacterium]|nr:MAG: FMN-binding protein [Acidobacteriota bacterium]
MASDKKGAGPFRLIATLGLAGLFSGLVLVTVYLATQPLILENQAKALEAAIYQVVPGSETRKAYVVEDGKLVPFNAQGNNLPSGDAVFAALDAQGKLVGFGIPSEGAGFQDTIKLIYGYNPENKRVTGMQVLESRETPGLGDKIIKDLNFLSNFENLAIEPEVVSVAAGSKKNENEVDSISGATISSKAIVKIINSGNSKYLSLISALMESEEKP